MDERDGLRLNDGQRDACIRVLNEAYMAGQLTTDELDERLQRVMTVGITQAKARKVFAGILLPKEDPIRGHDTGPRRRELMHAIERAQADERHALRATTRRQMLAPAVMLPAISAIFVLIVTHAINWQHPSGDAKMLVFATAIGTIVSFIYARVIAGAAARDMRVTSSNCSYSIKEAKADLRELDR